MKSSLTLFGPLFTLLLWVGCGAQDTPGPERPVIVPEAVTELFWSRPDDPWVYNIGFVEAGAYGSGEPSEPIVIGTTLIAPDGLLGPRFVEGEDQEVLATVSLVAADYVLDQIESACSAFLVDGTEWSRCEDPVELKVFLPLGTLRFDRVGDEEPARAMIDDVGAAIFRYFRNGRPFNQSDEDLLADREWPIPTRDP